MYLNLYVPQLQYDLGVVGFFRGHRGATIASSALMDPITRAFVTAIEHFVEESGVDLVNFEKGQRKDDVALAYLADFEGDEGVLFVGKAQEKTTAYRTEKRRNPVTGRTYPWIVRTTIFVNHYYVYCVDADFGPFFIKFCSYFPYNAKCCINGNEWAKRQAAAAGIAFEPLDNGFLSCDGARAAQPHLRPPWTRPDRSPRPQVAAPPASPLQRRGPAGRLPLRHFGPPGRILLDPDPGPAPLGAGLLRGGDP